MVLYTTFFFLKGQILSLQWKTGIILEWHPRRNTLLWLVSLYAYRLEKTTKVFVSKRRIYVDVESFLQANRVSKCEYDEN